jgi:transcriptional regulator with XRE-family HTH domain
MYSMNTSHSDTEAAIELGAAIRKARLKCGLTIADTAAKIGRNREWLNRAELGYSTYGEHRPPSESDVQALYELLSKGFDLTLQELNGLRERAETDFQGLKQNTRPRRRTSGKLTQTELVIGESNVAQAIVDLINVQHSDAIIRNTGIKVPGTYRQLTDHWKRYREALGKFLADNPNSLFKRLEYAATPEQLELAKEADSRLAGGRKLNKVHNAKVKFTKENPLQLHVLIGQREAILALPQASGQAGSNMALLVRDKLFVEALRVWYDEVLWECSPGKQINFTFFNDSFEEVKRMYGFKD